MSKISDKLAALRAARTLRSGGLIAHYTGTVAGVAAWPGSSAGVDKICRFKQRQGPFLLLADSAKTAKKQVRFFSPLLRRQMRENWPGPVTFIVPARPGLNDICYNGSQVAIRVDASLQTRQLARACGGVLLSSSFNRKGGSPGRPDLRSAMRMHACLDGCLTGPEGAGMASTMIKIRRNHSSTLRA